MASVENQSYYQLVINTCLLAGKIMVENGSDLQRVEDTIYRIGHNAKMKSINAYITVTMIIVSSTDPNIPAQMINVNKRSFNLTKVVKVNDLSRKFAAEQINIETFYQQLQLTDIQNDFFSLKMQVLGAILVSGPLVVVFRDNVIDALPACAVAAITWVFFYFMNRYFNIRFVSEFSSAFLLAGISALMVRIGWAHNMDDLIIGSVMPLLPGIPLTNAVRDLLAGNLVSGPARGVEALISACALGFGVAVGLHLF